MAKKLGWNASTNATPASAGKTNKSSVSSGPTPTKVQKNTGKVGTKRGSGRPRKDSAAVVAKEEQEEEDMEDNDGFYEEKREVVKKERFANKLKDDGYRPTAAEMAVLNLSIDEGI